MISRLLLAPTPTHNIDRATTTNNTITSYKHKETQDLSQGLATPQSCAYVPDVEAMTKVLRVSLNSPLSQATTKMKPGIFTGTKGDTNFPAPLTSKKQGHHQATPSWLGFQEPKSNRAKTNH